MVDGKPHIGEEGECDSEQQDAGNADLLAPCQQDGKRGDRHGEIISVALLEAERARRKAANMLEAERSENGRCREQEHTRRRPHNLRGRPGEDRLARRVHLRTHTWR